MKPPRYSTVLCISWLALVLGYAVFKYGGVVSADWNVCLLALGLLALVYWLMSLRIEPAPRLEQWLWWPLVLLPVYVAFQLIPLPAFVLRILSPARAELLDALNTVGPGPAHAPLSVTPSATMSHLLRILAYTVVFLVVREIGWRCGRRPWVPALPIIAVGSLEATLGLLQYVLGPPGSFARGTYVNRAHFAGLLEMALPFAVMYPVAIARREPRRAHLSARRAVLACLMIALSALIFAGIVYSLSRMGFIVSLCSLFVIGAALLSARLPARKRWLALGLAGVLVVCGFVFLSPDALIQRFARVPASKELTVEGRLLIWKDTLPLVEAYPLFGCGLGAYESAFEKFNVSMPRFGVDFAHNDYLQLLAELGTLGFALTAALMLGIFVQALRAAARHSDFEGRCLGLACVSATVAIFIHSIMDFNLYIPANALLLAWISGIGAGLQNRKIRNVGKDLTTARLATNFTNYTKKWEFRCSL